MAMPENLNWIYEYGPIEDMPVLGGDFPPPSAAFNWPSQTINNSANVNVDIEGSFCDSDCLKETGSRKRVRSEASCASGSKACSILEPGRPPKMDKTAILSDAVRMVIQLRTEAQKLKESNETLQDKIKELKAEKNELRDEKQRLKVEKEKLEQQVKAMSAQPSYLAHPPAIPAAFAAQSQAAGNKLMPFMGYPGVAMWQFMPAAAVDTSQDHVLRPPVA
ncbi:hypothetical protein Sjap_003374 [Stephania japonica]|uniref:Uncharacterized protein n=1 Tax=Stephania japonica TaxID=461633 RepID=A0AAP0KR19_9MAGN